MARPIGYTRSRRPSLGAAMAGCVRDRNGKAIVLLVCAHCATQVELRSVPTVCPCGEVLVCGGAALQRAA